MKLIVLKHFRIIFMLAIIFNSKEILGSQTIIANLEAGTFVLTHKTDAFSHSNGHIDLNESTSTQDLNSVAQLHANNKFDDSIASAEPLDFNHEVDNHIASTESLDQSHQVELTQSSKNCEMQINPTTDLKKKNFALSPPRPLPVIWESQFSTIDHSIAYEIPVDISQKRACSSVAFPIDMYLRFTEGRGIGYKRGYSTLGAMWTPFRYSKNCLQPLMDARVHLFNNGKWAANLGIGLRYTDPFSNRTLGVNAFYDYRSSWQDYHQLGLGVEMLGCQFDLRANGYFPIGDKTHKKIIDIVYYTGRRYTIHYDRQVALTGVDAEIETSLRKWCHCPQWNLYLAIGPYYYNGNGSKNNVLGGKVRFGIEYLNLLTFEVKVTDDNRFHNRVQGIFGINFAFGHPDCCCAGNERLKIQRNEIIALKKHEHWLCRW